MSKRVAKDQALIPSLLDRLLDDDPTVSQEPPTTASQSYRQLKQSVQRDLEDLLNTRWRCVSWPPDLRQLDVSMVNYGIPDFSGAKMNSAGDAEVLLRFIEVALRNFEPRLRSPKVELSGNLDALDRTLRFRIDALLKVEPLEHPVAFVSTLDPSTGSFNVRGTEK